MSVVDTLEQTRVHRSSVEPAFLPLFDHLLVLAQDDIRRGDSQGAGRMLRKARKLAGHHAPMRPAAQSRRVSRGWLGSKLLNWHGGMGDPIYAVGSFYIDERKYPDQHVVERAFSEIEDFIPKAEHGASGWTKRDAGELRTIAAGLRYYLKHDYA